eukprot:GHVQ01037108.1.p1 GENE.GHVQ01037108.1~~GHVQ01037108.1.p1  ORF type:complete len:288 (+),score=39.93 GHVQ01037108.1:646-1509(+)
MFHWLSRWYQFRKYRNSFFLSQSVAVPRGLVYSEATEFSDTVRPVVYSDRSEQQHHPFIRNWRAADSTEGEASSTTMGTTAGTKVRPFDDTTLKSSYTSLRKSHERSEPRASATSLQPPALRMTSTALFSTPVLSHPFSPEDVAAPAHAPHFASPACPGETVCSTSLFYSPPPSPVPRSLATWCTPTSSQIFEQSHLSQPIFYSPEKPGGVSSPCCHAMEELPVENQTGMTTVEQHRREVWEVSSGGEPNSGHNANGHVGGFEMPTSLSQIRRVGEVTEEQVTEDVP